MSGSGQAPPDERARVGWAGRWMLVRAFWQADIVARGKEPELLLTLAFLLSFGAVRFITYSIKNDWLPIFGNVTTAGMHIHHMVPGMLLVLVAGYFGLVMGENRPTRLLSVLFGVGTALVLDEFALWLRLADVYWRPEGRESIEAVIVAVALGVLYLAGWDFLRHVGWLLVGRLRRLPPPAHSAADRREVGSPGGGGARP
ncbi:MAG TPA: hypothetical protein VII06_03755 [Chloroflexota bacterium]